MPESETMDNFSIFAAAKARVSEVLRTSSKPPGENELLVARAVAGDHQAFHELHARFAPMVHGIILSHVPPDEAQDIAQEVFLMAYRKLGSLRNHAAFGPWLATMARNCSTSYYRGQRPVEELSDNIRSNDAPVAEANEILAAIRDLPDTYRETLVLRLVEGMTGPEISSQTGMTPDSVRVNLHRGMKMLRRKLGIEV